MDSVAEVKAWISRHVWTSEQVAAWVQARFVSLSLYRQDLEGVQTDITALETDVGTLTTDLTTLEGAVTTLDAAAVKITGDQSIAGAKTFTGQVNVTDTLFSIRDNGDPTKIAQFNAVNITAGTTRTYAFPDEDTGLVGTATTQTLHNKTLVTPTIADFTNAAHGHLDADDGGVLAGYVDVTTAQSIAGEKTFTDGIIMDGTFHSVSVALADDTATSFVPTAIGGMLLVTCTNSANVWGIANYRTSVYMTAMIDGTALTFTSGVLAGTTGVDGQVTVSQSGSNIYIENRLGGTRTFVFLFIN